MTHPMRGFQEVIRREARLKGYIVVEDENGLRVSRMHLASMTGIPRVAAVACGFSNGCQYISICQLVAW